jgi:aspartate racemase
MKTIGLLGGMSWVSTTHYYRTINIEIGRRLGGHRSASLVLWQTDFARITALQEQGRWDDAGTILAGGARALVGAGADLVAICANTMHLVAEPVAAAARPARLVSIVDAVLDACLDRGVTRLGLLGTAYTMESPNLFPRPLAEANIEVLVPDAALRDLVQRHTFDELIHDVVTDAARETFQRAAADFVARGADAVVLACTEHGLVLRDGDLPVPVLDSSELHIAALVDAALT